MVAKEDGVAQGEEITISYVNPQWPGPLRREFLKRDYGFDCRCPKCDAELQEEGRHADKPKPEDQNEDA